MNRGSRWMSWAAASAAATVALTGCVDGEEPEPSGSPPPSTTEAPTPSDADLLAEARSVYEEFLAASLAMWNEPNVDYRVFLEWSNDEIASLEAAGHEELRAQGVASVGPITLNSFALADSPTVEEVDVLLCLDFSQARRLDVNGTDITPADAMIAVPLQVRFESTDGRDPIVTEQEALPNGTESPCV